MSAEKALRAIEKGRDKIPVLFLFSEEPFLSLSAGDSHRIAQDVLNPVSAATDVNMVCFAVRVQAIYIEQCFTVSGSPVGMDLNAPAVLPWLSL